MPYPHILAAVAGAIWAVRPTTLGAITATLRAHLDSPRSDSPVAAASPAPGYVVVNGVALIPVWGIIGQHLSIMEMACGGYDLDTLGQDVATALADPAVQCLALDFNSPGGTTTGIPEAAAMLRAAGQVKPLVAYTDSMCCSAAYWLASACGQIAATPSAELGSIGVYCALVDESAAWANEGLKLELMKAGTFKAAGIAGLPLSDTDRAQIQSRVDSLYEMFAQDVNALRPQVARASMQGQGFLGAEAHTAGLVDGIVSGRAEFLARVSAGLAATLYARN